jgi:hypothetical protein
VASLRCGSRAGGSSCSGARTSAPAARRSRTPRHGLGGAALGRRVFVIQGGVTPGLSFSRAIEMLDIH